MDGLVSASLLAALKPRLAGGLLAFSWCVEELADLSRRMALQRAAASKMVAYTPTANRSHARL